MQIHLRLIAIISAGVLALNLGAQVLDVKSRHIVDRYSAHSSAMRKAAEEQVFLPAILRLTDGATTIADLEEMGAKVLRQRDDLVLAFVPVDRIDQLVTFSGVNRVSVADPNRLTMDRALPFSHADRLIGLAEGMPRSWSGRGVVVGLTDDGLDPHHPNFLTLGGEHRIKRMVTYKDTLAVKTVATDPAEFVTDDVEEWHATHVLGIMAGSCTATPYRGIASEAEIVATMSQLTDACILDGVEEIIDYARGVGKPAVVNMSLGSFTGPHDGTTLFNQYLDKLGKEAIIVMSVGNEGKIKLYFRHQFTPEETTKSVCITDVKWWNCQRNLGSADFWSQDDREFQLALEVRDMSTQTIVATFPMQGGSDAREWEIAAPGYATTAAAVHSDEFDKYYRGYFRLTAGTDPDNGRFHIYTSMDLSCTDLIGEMGRYFVTVTLQGDPGVTVEAYADGYQLEFNQGGSGKFARPSADRSISDIACGHNVIVVGAATSRNTAPSLAGPILDYTWHVEGEMAPWSSYGVLDDGRSLPHISAPGCYIVSSCSADFVRKHPDVEGELSAKAIVNGQEAWWVSECGTSMSAPYVAGVVALMLEEDPTLTVEEVRQILVDTADRDIPHADDIRWGAGRLNAVAAMTELLRLNGVGDVVVDGDDCAVVVEGNNIIIVSSSDSTEPIRVYALDGRCVLNAALQGHHTVIDASSLPSGIYIVSTLYATHKIKK